MQLSCRVCQTAAHDSLVNTCTSQGPNFEGGGLQDPALHLQGRPCGAQILGAVQMNLAFQDEVFAKQWGISCAVVYLYGYVDHTSSVGQGRFEALLRPSGVAVLPMHMCCAMLCCPDVSVVRVGCRVGGMMPDGYDVASVDFC
jgi:hypothetical protein